MILNNNPGNIRRTQGTPWQGEIVPSPWRAGFVVFDTLEHGYRAVLLLLNNYIAKGFNTIEKIITRWAPPSENNTAAYIDFVSRYTMIPKNFVVQTDSQAARMIAAAISEYEHSGSLTSSDLEALNVAAAKLQGIPTASSSNVTGAQTAGGGTLFGIVTLLLFLAYNYTRSRA